MAVGRARGLCRRGDSIPALVEPPSSESGLTQTQLRAVADPS